MIIEVHFTGNQFVAFYPDGQVVKNREILEAIAFEPLPGFKTNFLVEIDETKIPLEVKPMDVNINITHTGDKHGI